MILNNSMKTSEFKAIILAAGRGSRMKLLTEKQPKCRAVLHGKQLIEWQMEVLKAAGIDDISIVRGYLSGNFKYQLKYFENERWSGTNMVASLLKASEWLDKYPCIISYSDIVYSPDAVNRLQNIEGDITIAYDKNWIRLWSMRFNDPLSDAETFQLDQNLVVEIGGKASSIDEIEGQYMGLFRFTPNGWFKVKSYLNSIPQNVVDDLDMTSLFQLLIKEKIPISAVPIVDNWYEVDSQDDLNCYQKLSSLW
jgi:L-glutamine-phosphate cytidylyltransferase